MSWRKGNRRRRQGERPFGRRVKYETFKEGGGTLLQQAGAALGALIGLLASRWGMPPTASVITGAIVGSTIGAVGRGFVTAAADHLKERGDQRRQQRGDGRARVAHRRRRRVISIAEVKAGIDTVTEQIERAHNQLSGLADRMRATHGMVMMVMSGGRSDVLQQTHARLTTARTNVEESRALLSQAYEDLHGYRAII